MPAFTPRTLKKCLLIFIICLLLPIITSAATVQIIDNQNSGVNTSLVLDANGFPVIARTRFTNNTNTISLEVFHCDDPLCDGIGDSQVIIDFGVYRRSQILLDANGFPVIATYEQLSDKLIVIHCDDPNCVSHSLEEVDDGGTFPSLTLDSVGNPVISYTDNDALKLVHCNDPDCAGGDESIEFVNTFPETFHTSMALGTNGLPIISHIDNQSNLVITSCNDPNCAGGDENSQLVYTNPLSIDVDRLSLLLDANGFPIVAYSVDQIGILLLSCTNVTCTTNINSLVVPEVISSGNNGVSLQLNGNLPVIAYTQDSRIQDREFAVVIIECNDANCLGNDEIVIIVEADPAGVFGFGKTAMKLDANACPIIVYSQNNADLTKIANACSISDPIYDSEPSTGSPISLEGEAGTVAFQGIAVENIGADGTQLNVSVNSITTGYSVSAALPFTNLSPADDAINFRVLCTVGSSPATGTLSLTTNDPLRPTVGYPLSCGASGTVSNPSDASSDSDPPVPDFLQQVTELPSTGEPPAWRDWLWVVSVILGGIGIFLLLPIRRTKQS